MHNCITHHSVENIAEQMMNLVEVWRGSRTRRRNFVNLPAYDVVIQLVQLFLGLVSAFPCQKVFRTNAFELYADTKLQWPSR